MELGQFNKAIYNFDKSSRMNKNKGEAYFLLGVTLIRTKNFHTAIKELGKALELNHKAKQCSLMLADI